MVKAFHKKSLVGYGNNPNKASSSSISQEFNHNANFKLMQTKIPKHIRVLLYFYQNTLKGESSTAFGSFTANADTSFRKHISILQSVYSIHIQSHWVCNPHTHSRYKEYTLAPSSIHTTQQILAKFGLLGCEVNQYTSPKNHKTKVRKLCGNLPLLLSCFLLCKILSFSPLKALNYGHLYGKNRWINIQQPYVILFIMDRGYISKSHEDLQLPNETKEAKQIKSQTKHKPSKPKRQRNNNRKLSSKKHTYKFEEACYRV